MVLTNREARAEVSTPSNASPSECRLYQDSTFTMSESDYRDLCLIVRAEAGDESFLGQMAVVEVIGNRVESESFPNSCIKVLSQSGQFSTWRGRNRKTIMQSQIDAVETVRMATSSVLEPFIYEAKRNGSIDQRVQSKDYLYFCTPSAYKRIGHRYMHNTIQIGNHIFGTN